MRYVDSWFWYLPQGFHVCIWAIDWHHFRQNGHKSIILVSTIGFSIMSDIMVWLESSLDIALWVESKMAAICEKQKLIQLSTEWKQIRDFGEKTCRIFIYTPLWLANIILDSLYTKMAVIRQTKWPSEGHYRAQSMCNFSLGLRATYM